MAGYIRQSTFVDGDTITAALFNNEYNQLVNAFSNTSGHKHDGTTAEGPVIGLIGDAGETSPNNKVLIDTTNNHIEFYVEVSSNPVQQIYIADGAIVPVTDSDVDLGTSSLEFKDLYLDGTAHIDTLDVDANAGIIGNATVGGTLGVTGNTTLTANLTVNGNTTLGNAASDTVTITADVASDIIPSADSTHALGDSSNYWSHGYIDAITTTGNVAVGGNLTVTGTTTFNGGTITMGDAATDNVVFGADVDSNIIPDDDNTYDLGSSSQEWKDLYIDGIAYLDGINFNGTAITSTAAELNILDGVTSTAAELNLLDGVTSTTAELNILDGVTASATDINLIDGITNGTVIASKAIITDSNKDITGGRNITISGELDAATLDISGNADIDGTLETDALSINGTTVTSTAAELNILDGVTASATDINLIDGITNGTVIASKAIITDSNKDITGGRNITISGELDAATLDISGNADIDGTLETDALSINGTTVTSTAAELNILDGVTATAAEINLLDGVTATTAELNALDGITSTVAELNILDGVTSTAAELNLLDGSSANTVVNSKAVVYGSSGELAGTLSTAAQTNITSLGTLASASIGSTLTINNTDSSSFGTIEMSGTSGAFIDLKTPSSDDFDIRIQTTGTGGIIDTGSGEVTIKRQGSTKLATTSTGIQVTGATLVSDDGADDFIKQSVSATTSTLSFGNTESTGGTAQWSYNRSTGSLSGNIGTAAGTNFMTVLGTGKVGIGTGANIDAPLHVQYTGTGSGLVLESTEAGASNAPDLVLYRNSSSPADSDDIGNILFRGKDDAGNDTSYAFIMGEINDASDGSEDGNLFFRTQSGGSLDNRLSIVSNNIGIGTSSPLGTLHVNGDIIADAGANNGFGFERGGVAYSMLEFGATSADELSLFNKVNNDLVFGTNSTERMRIDSSGNVGIGETSPDNLLHVKGTTSILAKLESTGTNTNARILFKPTDNNGWNIGANDNGNFTVFDSTNSANSFVIETGADGNTLVLDSSSNVGIGTSGPVDKLQITTSGAGNPYIGFDHTGDNPYMEMQRWSGSASNYFGTRIKSYQGELAFETTGSSPAAVGSQTFSEAMRIDDSGNVGIGTSNPSTKLHVVGGVIEGRNNAQISNQTNQQLVLTDSDNTNMRANFMIEDTGTRGGLAIQATEATVSNDRDLMLQPLGGRVGIGTTQPQRHLHVNSSGEAFIRITSSDSGNAGIEFGDQSDGVQGAIFQNASDNSLRFNGYNNSERMRISSAGNIFIGTTSGVRGAEMISIDGGAADVMCMDTSSAGIIIRKTAFTNGFLQLFEVESNGFDLGSITTDGSTVSYTSASDYRLKENIQPMENGLNRLKQLNPVKFEWKGTGKQSEGFIAHEVDEIYSDCVEGEKDGERMQTLDYGKITPLLVKAIQEQQTQIDALQSEINLLKGE